MNYISYIADTIAERFPEQHWLHVYIDGSAIGADLSAGAGVYSKYLVGPLVLIILTIMVKWLLSIWH